MLDSALFDTDDIGPALRFHQASADPAIAPVPCSITWCADPDPTPLPRRARATPRWIRKSRPPTASRRWQRKSSD